MSNEITGRISSNTITGRISSDTIITSNVIYGHTHSNKKILDQILSGSSGDMLVSIYDPNFVNGDAFSVDNHVSGTINKVYTLVEQSKLSSIAEGAEINVQPDWDATTGDTVILNKPVGITTQNTVTDSANTFTLDLSLKKNFTITIADVNPKIITLTNIPPDLDFALPVTVKVVCTVGNIISTYPTGTIWVDGVVPVFAIGKTYYLTFIRTTAGWHAIYLGAF